MQQQQQACQPTIPLSSITPTPTPTPSSPVIPTTEITSEIASLTSQLHDILALVTSIPTVHSLQQQLQQEQEHARIIEYFFFPL